MADKTGYSFRYSDNIIGRATELPSFSEASAEDLRVLLALLKCGCDCDRETLMGAACCDGDELSLSLQFWRGAGLLSLTRAKKGDAADKKEQRAENGEKAPKEKEAKEKRALRSEDKLYEANSAELAEMINREKLQTLIDACQQTVGKILNTAEINIIVGMHNQLSLEGEYILMLISYCYENNKSSMKYVEKVAFSLCDKGIMTAKALETYLEERRRFASFEWQIKKMFGIGDRDFTKKQEEYVLKWELEYKYGIEIVGLAYDITVDNINKVDFRYIDKILSGWHEKNLRTEREIQAHEEKEKASRKEENEKRNAASAKEKREGAKNKSSVGYNSFDVDDFFSKAVERSYKKKQ